MTRDRLATGLAMRDAGERGTQDAASRLHLTAARPANASGASLEREASFRSESGGAVAALYLRSGPRSADSLLGEPAKAETDRTLSMPSTVAMTGQAPRRTLFHA